LVGEAVQWGKADKISPDIPSPNSLQRSDAVVGTAVFYLSRA